MFNFILLIGTTILFFIGFILLMKDLRIKYKLRDQNLVGKITKETSYSLGFSLLALILMVFVSFSYIE
jgi:hypothetical protein